MTAVLERVRIRETRQGAGITRVVAYGSGRRVRHGDGVAHVRKGPREHPESAVERAAVHDLDDELDVVRAEEPEISRVAGQRHRESRAARPLRGHPPVDLDAEPPGVQAQ